MYELIQVSENTYYMDCPSKVGFYRTENNSVVLIDSGSDKDAAKKVKKILDSNSWKLEAIYNTHSHADHIGGNQYLQDQTGCLIYSPEIECSFTQYPILEPTFLYGGTPVAELQSKFLLAAPSQSKMLTADSLPPGLDLIKLPGHSFNMVGFRTKDNVVFLADCLAGAETIQKYRIAYLYNVRSYLETLEMVKNLKADLFIPSHAQATADIGPLAQLNIEKVRQIISTITDILNTPETFEETLTQLFNRLELSMTIQQNVLVGGTVKSYLAYLREEKSVDFRFENNRMLWYRT